MAPMNKEKIDLKGILLLMLLTIPSQATNLDCNGKAFHCVNSTHFMICVDVGRGVSTTIDDFVIPCPTTTTCRPSNRFECEFPAPTSPVEVTTAAIEVLSEVTVVNSHATTSIPFEEYFNTLSTTTLSQSDLQTSTTDSILSEKQMTGLEVTSGSKAGLQIKNEETPSTDANVNTEAAVNTILNGRNQKVYNQSSNNNAQNHDNLDLTIIPFVNTTEKNNQEPNSISNVTEIPTVSLPNNYVNETAMKFTTASNQITAGITINNEKYSVIESITDNLSIIPDTLETVKPSLSTTVKNLTFKNDTIIKKSNVENGTNNSVKMTLNDVTTSFSDLKDSTPSNANNKQNKYVTDSTTSITFYNNLQIINATIDVITEKSNVDERNTQTVHSSLGYYLQTTAEPNFVVTNAPSTINTTIAKASKLDMNTTMPYEMTTVISELNNEKQNNKKHNLDTPLNESSDFIAVYNTTETLTTASNIIPEINTANIENLTYYEVPEKSGTNISRHQGTVLSAPSPVITTEYSTTVKYILNRSQSETQIMRKTTVIPISETTSTHSPMYAIPSNSLNSNDSNDYNSTTSTLNYDLSINNGNTVVLMTEPSVLSLKNTIVKTMNTTTLNSTLKDEVVWFNDKKPFDTLTGLSKMSTANNKQNKYVADSTTSSTFYNNLEILNATIDVITEENNFDEQNTQTALSSLEFDFKTTAELDLVTNTPSTIDKTMAKASKLEMETTIPYEITTATYEVNNTKYNKKHSLDTSLNESSDFNVVYNKMETLSTASYIIAEMNTANIQNVTYYEEPEKSVTNISGYQGTVMSTPSPVITTEYSTTVKYILNRSQWETQIIRNTTAIPISESTSTDSPMYATLSNSLHNNDSNDYNSTNSTLNYELSINNVITEVLLTEPSVLSIRNTTVQNMNTTTIKSTLNDEVVWIDDKKHSDTSTDQFLPLSMTETTTGISNDTLELHIGSETVTETSKNKSNHLKLINLIDTFTTENIINNIHSDVENIQYDFRMVKNATHKFVQNEKVMSSHHDSDTGSTETDTLNSNIESLSVFATESKPNNKITTYTPSQQEQTTTIKVSTENAKVENNAKNDFIFEIATDKKNMDQAFNKLNKDGYNTRVPQTVTTNIILTEVHIKAIDASDVVSSSTTETHINKEYASNQNKPIDSIIDINTIYPSKAFTAKFLIDNYTTSTYPSVDTTTTSKSHTYDSFPSSANINNTDEKITTTTEAPLIKVIDSSSYQSTVTVDLREISLATNTEIPSPTLTDTFTTTEKAITFSEKFQKFTNNFSDTTPYIITNKTSYESDFPLEGTSSKVAITKPDIASVVKMTNTTSSGNSSILVTLYSTVATTTVETPLAANTSYSVTDSSAHLSNTTTIKNVKDTSDGTTRDTSFNFRSDTASRNTQANADIHNIEESSFTSESYSHVKTTNSNFDIVNVTESLLTVSDYHTAGNGDDVNISQVPNVTTISYIESTKFYPDLAIKVSNSGYTSLTPPTPAEISSRSTDEIIELTKNINNNVILNVDPSLTTPRNYSYAPTNLIGVQDTERPETYVHLLLANVTQQDTLTNVTRKSTDYTNTNVNNAILESVNKTGMMNSSIDSIIIDNKSPNMMSMPNSKQISVIGHSSGLENVTINSSKPELMKEESTVYADINTLIPVSQNKTAALSDLPEYGMVITKLLKTSSLQNDATSINEPPNVALDPMTEINNLKREVSTTPETLLIDKFHLPFPESKKTSEYVPEYAKTILLGNKHNSVPNSSSTIPSTQNNLLKNFNEQSKSVNKGSEITESEIKEMRMTEPAVDSLVESVTVNMRDQQIALDSIKLSTKSNQDGKPSSLIPVTKSIISVTNTSAYSITEVNASTKPEISKPIISTIIKHIATNSTKIDAITNPANPDIEIQFMPTIIESKLNKKAAVLEKNLDTGFIDVNSSNKTATQTTELKLSNNNFSPTETKPSNNIDWNTSMVAVQSGDTNNSSESKTVKIHGLNGIILSNIVDHTSFYEKDTSNSAINSQQTSKNLQKILNQTKPVISLDGNFTTAQDVSVVKSSPVHITDLIKNNTGINFNKDRSPTINETKSKNTLNMKTDIDDIIDTTSSGLLTTETWNVHVNQENNTVKSARNVIVSPGSINAPTTEVLQFETIESIAQNIQSQNLQTKPSSIPHVIDEAADVVTVLNVGNNSDSENNYTGVKSTMNTNENEAILTSQVLSLNLTTKNSELIDLSKREEHLELLEKNNTKSSNNITIKILPKINGHNSTKTATSENKNESHTLEFIEINTSSFKNSSTSNITSKQHNKRTTDVHIITDNYNGRNSTSRYTSQTKIATGDDTQSNGFPAFKSTTTSKPNTNKFTCKHKIRGRYADELDCRKFYICLGNSHVIEGSCPINTVFSDIRKQCTKNLSQCIRNNQFRCVTEGHFSDFLNDNIYYICVKSDVGSFIRYKLQCQNGYHLNKSSVRCELNKTSKQLTSASKNDSSKNNSDQSVSFVKLERKKKSKKFQCKKEGNFVDPSDCKRYFECRKTDVNRYRLKRKKCGTDEIFNKDSKKCEQDDTNEC